MSKVPESYKRKLDRDAKIAAADEAAAKAAATVIFSVFYPKVKSMSLLNSFLKCRLLLLKQRILQQKPRLMKPNTKRLLPKFIYHFLNYKY